MADEAVDSLKSPGAPPAGAAAADAPPSPADAPPMRRYRAKKSRRRWARWVANLMIVAGVLLLAYPLGDLGLYLVPAARASTRVGTKPARVGDGRRRPRIGRSGRSYPTDDRARDRTGPRPAPAVAPRPPSRRPRPNGSPHSPRSGPRPTNSTRAHDSKAGEPIGRVVVPSIGVDVVMVEGTGKGDLREGPGHWPETPFPGQGGNFVVSGHRTTYGAPFFKLNKVKIGDEIDLLLPYGVARYVVTRTVIVYPKDVESVAQLGKEQISLAACHPIYSARQRIVVQGDLVGFKLIQQ